MSSTSVLPENQDPGDTAAPPGRGRGEGRRRQIGQVALGVWLQCVLGDLGTMRQPVLCLSSPSFQIFVQSCPLSPVCHLWASGQVSGRNLSGQLGTGTRLCLHLKIAVTLASVSDGSLGLLLQISFKIGIFVFFYVLSNPTKVVTLYTHIDCALSLSGPY